MKNRLITRFGMLVCLSLAAFFVQAQTTSLASGNSKKWYWRYYRFS